MFNKLLAIYILLLFALLPVQGWAQNETPANVPQQQPTTAPAPTNQPQEAPQTAPTSRPVRERTPVSVGDEVEEKPLYMNMAVYVGGGCFLVVFIGLYMILSSSPSSRSKRRRNKE